MPQSRRHRISLPWPHAIPTSTVCLVPLLYVRMWLVPGPADGSSSRGPVPSKLALYRSQRSSVVEHITRGMSCND
jgi:hypothetical protein